jgi:hypothetical protein
MTEGCHGGRLRVVLFDMSNLTAWSDEIGRRVDSMIALRRDFHRHPELSFPWERGLSAL